MSEDVQIAIIVAIGSAFTAIITLLTNLFISKRLVNQDVKLEQIHVLTNSNTTEAQKTIKELRQEIMDLNDKAKVLAKETLDKTQIIVEKLTEENK